MFGRIMQFETEQLSVKLAPLTREVMSEFVSDGGLQAHTVGRYLQRQTAPVLEDELDWYDKTRHDNTTIVWGIWAKEKEGKSWQLIGNSSFTHLERGPFYQAVTGSMIHRPEYWGRGIATRAHKARTWYGFHVLGLDRIKSAVIVPNLGSLKALQRSGYVIHSMERNVHFTDGELQHRINLECLNPSDSVWQRWWGEDAPSQEALNARERTRAAMGWAANNINLL